MKKVLIISPHLDDETLGAGGTILAHKELGDQIFWINVTLPSNVEKQKRRNKEREQIAKFYDFEETYQMDFTSTELEGQNKKMVGDFSKLIKEIQPNILYIPNRSDVHADHRHIFNAVYSCTKSFRYPYIEKVLMYEVLSETEFAPALHESVFIPNTFIDISAYIEKKIAAMEIYHEELMKPQYPRSIESIKSLAHLRGTRIGCNYAEAFMLIFQKI